MKKVKLTFELQGKCMIFGVPDSFPLICQKHCKFAGPFLDPLQAVHFEFGAPYFLCKSLSSYRTKVKLTFELQGKCMIFWVPDSFPLICQKPCKFTAPFLHPPQAMHSELWAPYFLFTTNFPAESSHTFMQLIIILQEKSQINIRARGKWCKTLWFNFVT